MTKENIEIPSRKNTTPLSSWSATSMLETTMKISLAGFGGALAGISIAKRHTSLLSKSTLSSTVESSIQLEQYQSNLPMVWAIGCSAFAGVLEISSLVSPTSYLLLLYQAQFGNSDASFPSSSSSVDPKVSKATINTTLTLPLTPMNYLYWNDDATTTVGDYTFGGAVAGAIFQGNRILTAATKQSKNSNHSSSTSSSLGDRSKLHQQRAIKGKVITSKNKPSAKSIAKATTTNRMEMTHPKSSNVQKTASPSSTKITKSPPFSSPFPMKKGIRTGFLPGLTLGFIAGWIQLLIHRVNEWEEDLVIQEQIMMQEQKNEEKDRAVEGEDDTADMEEQIAREVKSMSTSEIREEIDRLRGSTIRKSK